MRKGAGVRRLTGLLLEDLLAERWLEARKNEYARSCRKPLRSRRNLSSNLPKTCSCFP